MAFGEWIVLALAVTGAALALLELYVGPRGLRTRTGASQSGAAINSSNFGDDRNDIFPFMAASRFLSEDFNASIYNASDWSNVTYNASYYNTSNGVEELISLPNPAQAPTVQNPTPLPTTLKPTPRPTLDPTLAPTKNPLEGMQGALVTSDCLFDNDYAYAIDIYWSCGDERFNNPLRLHTLKRHSRDHKRIFQDQLLTFRNNQLWFDAYNIPRCVRVDGDELALSSTAARCTSFEMLASNDNKYQIQETDTGRCMGLGGASCNSDRSTGGEECGGVDHRYLPLEMGDCNEALDFYFETEAQDCANNRNEFPENACF